MEDCGTTGSRREKTLYLLLLDRLRDTNEHHDIKWDSLRVGPPVLPGIIRDRRGHGNCVGRHRIRFWMETTQIFNQTRSVNLLYKRVGWVIKLLHFWSLCRWWNLDETFFVAIKLWKYISSTSVFTVNENGVRIEMTSWRETILRRSSVKSLAFCPYTFFLNIFLFLLF